MKNKNKLFIISSLLVTITPISLIAAKCKLNIPHEFIPNKTPIPESTPSITSKPESDNTSKSDSSSSLTPTPSPNPINPEPSEKEIIKNKEWGKEKGEINGLSFSSFYGLGNLYNLNNFKTVTEALDLLKPKEDSTKKIKVLNIKPNSYDDLAGILLLNFDLEIENRKLTNQEVKISGFKKVLSFKSEFITVSLKKEKLLEQNKNTSDLDSNDLEEFIEVKGISNGQTLDLIELTKSHSKHYSFLGSNNKIKLSDDKKSVTFTFVSKFSKKESGKEKQNIEEKTLVVNKSFQNNIEITDSDRLNLIMDKYVKVKSNIDLNNYPSSYLHLYRSTKKVVDNFVEITDNKGSLFGEGEENRIQFENQKLTVDDLKGEINIKFEIKVEKNGKDIHSKPKSFKIEGFKKLNSDYFKNNLFLFIDTTTKKGKKFVGKIQDEYKKTNKLNFQSFVGKLGIFNGRKWRFLRLKNSESSDAELEYKKHSLISLLANSNQINDVIVNSTQLKFFNNKENEIFEIENLEVEFNDVKVNNEDQTKVFVTINYNLEVAVNSGNLNLETLIIPMTTTFSFNKE